MLTYILDPTSEKREAIQYYGKISGLKIINILNGVESVYDRNNEQLNLPNTLSHVESEDFLKAFVNCSYVYVNELKKAKRILIVYGQDNPSEECRKALELFTSKYNCIIINDHIANVSLEHSLKPWNLNKAISTQEFLQNLAPNILITLGGRLALR